MSEVILELVEDFDGNVIITKENTINDILRYLVSCSSYSEIRFLLEMLEEEKMDE